jgi:hypothetical protein
MTLRPCFVLLLLAACATASGASPGEERPRPPPLRGGQCLDPDFVRSFTALDDRELLVDTGRYRYRIQVSSSCWHLHSSAWIDFRGDPVSNRVCGTVFDAVVPRSGVPCRIERMELLSREQYQQALRDHQAERRARREERRSGKD